MPNEEIYGVDYNSNGAVASNGDIATVNGLDNARQAIRNQLLTPIGSYPSIDDEYGSRIHELLGEDLTKAQIQALTVHIRNSLYKQERVQDIQDIEIQATPDGLKAILTVYLVNGSEITETINIGD